MNAHAFDLSRRIAAAKQALCFGEVAMALNLKGSSRTGWDCPACGSRATLRERPDRKGGRCNLPSCDRGFDAPGLVMTARGVSGSTALTFLERVINERKANGDPKAPSLFGGEHG
ncbi:MAG: hypothetical protein C0421_05805 [Hyphomonas sp.]|uniref:hypothetical protein n=1 Tax=Hyphomonas sp. TaxID=87 RepID=UPI0025C06DFD|nr:hypothetical protein [Hyphomonas sp.]MBA4338341.1 hypothetical protein [Hyphomonas sp.]